jgi:hypothetical protein
MKYNLEVRQGDETVTAQRSVMLATSHALWARVAELAADAYAPGRMIRVTNLGGEMIALIGVAAAVRLAAPSRAAATV